MNNLNSNEMKVQGLTELFNQVNSPPNPSFVLSACLAGVNCRFDGKTKTDRMFKKMADDGTALLVCPEVMGGLPTPRPPSELTGVTGEDVLRDRGLIDDEGKIVRSRLDFTYFPVETEPKTCGRDVRAPSGEDDPSTTPAVRNNRGIDVTNYYIRGAIALLKAAEKFNIKTAVLKSRSPACGVGRIYDGTFSKTLIDGDGIAATLLKKAGLKVVSNENYSG